MAHVLDLDSLPAGHLFLGGRNVAHIRRRVRTEPPREGDAGQRLRVGGLLRQHPQPARADDLHLIGGEQRLSQHLTQDIEDHRQVRTNGLAGEGEIAHSTRRAETSFVLIERVLDLLPRQLGGATHHQRGEQIGSCGFARQRLGGAVSQTQPEGDGVAAGFLGQQGDLQPVRELGPHRPLLDVLGVDLEGFSLRDLFPPLVIADHLGEVGRGRDGDAFGLLRGQEHPDGAVVALEVLFRDCLNRSGRHLLQTIPVQEHQPPVALSCPVAELDRDLLAIIEGQFPVLQPVGLGPVDLFLGHPLLMDRLDDLVESGQDFQRFVARSHLCRELEHTGVVQGIRDSADAGDAASLDERLVQPTARRRGEDVLQRIQRHVIGMCPGGDVVHRPDQCDIPDPSQRHATFTVLCGLFGVGVFQHAVWLGKHAKVLLDQAEGLDGVKLPGEDDHRVVGLVILLVEPLEVRDRHALDVGPVADRRLAVVVPLKGRRPHPLIEDPRRRVLAPLELVPHHRHLRCQVLAPDVAVDHAVRFQPQGELQVLIAGREGFEVVGAIQPRRAVEVCPVLLENARDFGVVGCPLEHHVLQQVGHPRLAVPLVPRPHEDRQIDRHLRLALIGKEQHAHAVVESKFGDSFHRCDRVQIRRPSGSSRHNESQEKSPDCRVLEPHGEMLPSGRCVRFRSTPSGPSGSGW